MNIKIQQSTTNVKRLKIRLEGVAYNIDLSIGLERLTAEKIRAIRRCIEFCVAPIQLCSISGNFIDDAEVAELSKIFVDNTIKQVRLCTTNITLEQLDFHPTPKPIKSHFGHFWNRVKPTHSEARTPLLSDKQPIPLHDLSKDKTGRSAETQLRRL